MKTFPLALLALACSMAISPTANAGSITYGPLTFGSNFPFADGGPCPTTGGCVEALIAPSVSGSAIGGPPSLSIQTTAFTFDTAPGWNIAGMMLGGTFDTYDPGENGPNPTPDSEWGYEFAQQITLCSAADVCSTATQIQTGGGAVLPSVLFTAAAGPGMGVYQTFIYLDDVSIQSDCDPQVNIFLNQASPSANLALSQPTSAPEPSSWLLLGTGLLGLVVVLRRNRLQLSQRPRPVPGF